MASGRGGMRAQMVDDVDGDYVPSPATPGSRGRTEMPPRPQQQQQQQQQGPPALSDFKRKKLAEEALAAAAGAAPPASSSPTPSDAGLDFSAASDSAQAQAQAQDQPATPKPALTEERDPYCFYPDNYRTFDKSKLCFESEGKPQTQNVGILKFVAYLFPDGRTKSLNVQFPKLFMPAGITTHKEMNQEKTQVTKVTKNLLCSFGKEWADNQDMVNLMWLVKEYREGLAELCFRKGLTAANIHSPADVLANMGDIVVEGKMKDKADPKLVVGKYPPSVVFSVNYAGNFKSKFFKVVPAVDPDDKRKRFMPLEQDLVARGSSIVPIGTFQWLFFKTVTIGKTEVVSYNTHLVLYVGAVEPSASISEDRVPIIM